MTMAISSRSCRNIFPCHLLKLSVLAGVKKRLCKCVCHTLPEAEKIFHGSTLISHSTGFFYRENPLELVFYYAITQKISSHADNGAGRTRILRAILHRNCRSPCQRGIRKIRIPVAVALPSGAGHCFTDPMLSAHRCRRYSHCCVVPIICLYAQIILCNSISLLLYAILLVLSMNFLLRKDFLCVDYFASTSLHDLSSPAPWSAT